MNRLVGDLTSGVALQFPSNGRWRAIQTCSNLPDREPLAVKLGQRNPLVQRELIVAFSHRNTLSWCCTSFENSGNPVRSHLRARESQSAGGRALTGFPSLALRASAFAKATATQRY